MKDRRSVGASRSVCKRHGRGWRGVEVGVFASEGRFGSYRGRARGVHFGTLMSFFGQQHCWFSRFALTPVRHAW